MPKRQGSMATIDDALNQTIVVNEEPIAPPPDASAPHAAPGVNAPTPVTGEKPEPRVLTAEEIAEEKNKSEREKLIDEAIKERERQEQERKDKFKTSANNVVDKFGQVWRGATVQLGRIPTPGSIILPLVVLLVFFFMLLPVNGHTRFVWLWLVLTGNANIGDNSGQNAGELAVQSGTTTTQTWTPPPGYHANYPGGAGPLGNQPIITRGASGTFGGASGTPTTGGGASGDFGNNGGFQLPGFSTFTGVQEP